MKYKLLLLVIASTLLTYLIYTTNQNYHLDIAIIHNIPNTYFENTITNNLQTLKINSTITSSYSSPYLNLFLLIKNIKSDTSHIQNYLHHQKIIIIFLNEPITNIQAYQQDLNTLLSLLRKINNHQIVIITPDSIPNSLYYQNLFQEYHINYFNTFNNNHPYLLSDYTQIANKTSQLIVESWSLSQN